MVDRLQELRGGTERLFLSIIPEVRKGSERFLSDAADRLFPSNPKIDDPDKTGKIALTCIGFMTAGMLVSLPVVKLVIQVAPESIPGVAVFLPIFTIGVFGGMSLGYRLGCRFA